MIKRAHLRHFLVVVETGGFTAAARRLNLTQPTLSTSVAELERHIGATLLLRDRRAIRLTPEGHRLLGQARAIEQEFAALESGFSTGHIAADPPLRIGVLASVPSRILVALRSRYGGARLLEFVEGTDADLKRRLAERQIQAALTLIRSPAAGQAVIDEPYVLLLSATHRLSGRETLRAEELGSETMIARRSCEILPETSKFFTSHGVRPHFLMRSGNDDRCMAMVAANLGITTGPKSLAAEGVVPIPLSGYDFRRTVGLEWAEGALDEKLAEAWRETSANAHVEHAG